MKTMYRTDGGKWWQLLFWQASFKRGYGGWGGCATWIHNWIQIEFIFRANYERMNEDKSGKGDFWHHLNKQLLCRRLWMQKNDINLFVAPSAWRRNLSSFCLDYSAKVAAYKAIQKFLNQIARVVKLPKRSRGSFALRSECLLNGRLTLTQSAEHSN